MALLFYSAVDDPDEWTAALRAHDPNLEVRVWPDIGDVEDIHAALVWRPKTGLLASMPNLTLIQSLGAGIDHVLRDTALPDGVPVARLVDPALTDQMVEYVVLAALHHHRRVEDYRGFQARGEWHQLPPADTGATRVGVMGVGVIGAKVAAALAGLGFQTAGWSRTPSTLDGIEPFHGADGLGPFLARSDIVACLLPLTAGTEGILDAAAFAALPSGGYVINAARGGHLVEADLLAALDSGHLSGAWLDVCHDEPLPPENPLWHHRRVILTPHIAGWVLPRTASAQVVENIGLVRAGKPPLNLVDRARGY
jgi:glyoxylate/hydroxypyruvate reductase A